jgi:hypothetical protein
MLCVVRRLDPGTPQPDPGAPQPQIDLPADQRRRRGPLSSRWRNTLFVPAATALAIVIVALVVVLGPGSSAPTVDQTVKLALSPATAPAPARDSAHPELLAAAVDGIPFPYYGSSSGWRTTGSRTQVVHERTVVTIYYRATDGTRIGYSIVPGASLSTPSEAATVRGGVRYTFGRIGPGRYVTWVRGGHTCVIAGTTVSDLALLRLASVDERVAV